MYPDADNFNPQRWLDPNFPTFKEPLTKYPTIQGSSSFGWGRRACPGSELTETELFTAIGSVVWAFDIKRQKDPSGKDVDVPFLAMADPVITQPLSFSLILEVRSEERRKLILQNAHDVPWSRIS